MGNQGFIRAPNSRVWLLGFSNRDSLDFFNFEHWKQTIKNAKNASPLSGGWETCAQMSVT